MEVICLEEEAFYKLIEKVVDRLKDKNPVIQERWLNEEQTKKLLNIRSKTTMQTLRDEGKIRYSQPHRKIILYDRDSIEDYLEQNAKNTF